MSETLSKTLHGDFDSVFCEVDQPHKVPWATDGQLRLFHLDVRNNEFTLSEMKKLLYRNIGEYVFSRARLENFKLNGDIYSVGAQALRTINKNGGADVKGTGGELGEMLLYAFLEEKLDAPKLMSRVELATDAKQYESTCDSIHLLTKAVSGKPYHQVVFGTSNIVGDIRYAIDGAFEGIARIDSNDENEISMINHTILDRMVDTEDDKDDIELARELFIPKDKSKGNSGPTYNTSYGVFLGYTLGLDPDKYSLDEFPQIMEEKIQEDIRLNIDYILDKIKDAGLTRHSFYFYVLPLNDAEEEKKLVMEALLKGDVDL